jgi:hypothetical protein
MAKILCSFKNSESNIPFFQIFDTYTGFTHTIPMDLITFLQYKGIRNKEFINVFYSLFNRLISNGSTLNLPLIFNKYSQELDVPFAVDLDENSTLKKEINEKLFDLFSTSNQFNEFYKTYLELIGQVNRSLPRPINYYNSYSQTSYCFSKYDSQIIQIANECLSILGETISCEEFLDKITSNKFINLNYKLSCLFYSKLGELNLIRIDSIPHIIRKDTQIEKIFLDYGLESLLPTRIPNYQLFSDPNLQLKEFNDLKSWRQFINHISFTNYDLALKFRGKNIVLMDQTQIFDALSGIYVYASLVNFVDSWGNIKLPMIYSDNRCQVECFQNKNHSVVFLDLFGMQDYYLFSKHGYMLSNSGYYDISYPIEDNFYILCKHDLNRVLIRYDIENDMIFEKGLKYDLYLDEVDLNENDLIDLNNQECTWYEKEILFQEFEIRFKFSNKDFLIHCISKFSLKEKELKEEFKSIIQKLDSTEQSMSNWSNFCAELINLDFISVKKENQNVNQHNLFVLDFNVFLNETDLTEEELPF